MAEITKTQLAYRLIRSRITSGAFPPGTRLNISELATQSGMSIIPVREAIKQLQMEGLVELDAYKGARVVSYTREELRELYLIRSVLEGLAVRLAAAHNDSTSIAKLEKILTTPKKSVTKANKDFHLSLYMMSRAERLYNMIINLWDTTYIINKGLLLHHVVGQKERSATEHKKILEAVRSGDGDLADALMRQHIIDAGNLAMNWIDKSEI